MVSALGADVTSASRKSCMLGNCYLEARVCRINHDIYIYDSTNMQAVLHCGHITTDNIIWAYDRTPDISTQCTDDIPDSINPQIDVD